MRSTVIIIKRGEGYISSVSGRFGGGHQGARCGLTPYEAAAAAAQPGEPGEEHNIVKEQPK